jgi:dihydrofolate reductase
VTDATRRARRRRPFDELELHVIPVLFGAGRRLFEGLPAEQIELERTRVLVGDGGVTHLHYRVRR